MMGPKQEAQSALFYDFSIEDHVPSDHILRAIDGVIDLSGVRKHLTEFYSSTGRPSIDPELMMRMLLVGYIMGIRSERRLCDEVHLNLAYRWFCKLDLNDPIPDHSTFSKNRHGRFRDSNMLRHVFETVVAQCIEAGLASGWRCSMAPESLPCMNPMERRLKMLKNRLREPLRPAEPRVKVLLAYGSQNLYPWKTEADNCHGT